MELWDGTGKTRVRQHVNPLRIDFQQPTAAPDWAAVFSDPSLPLALDIGSGYGRFLMLLQRNNPDQRVNYLGIEIRRPLVERSNVWAERLGLSGCLHYVFANATVSLATLMQGYPGPLTDVFIQFPDPHFKRRHHKRRVVQPQLVRALRDLMPPGGRLLLQSDVEDTAVAMRNMFERYGGEAFELAPQHRQRPVLFNRPVGTGAQIDDAAGYGATSGAVNGSEAGTAAAGALGREAEGGERHVHRTSATHTRDAEEESRPPSTAASLAVSISDQGLLSSMDEEHETDGDGTSGSDTDGGGGGGGDDDADIGLMVSEWAKGGWLVDNPVGTPTEREHYVSQQGLSVYRVLLVRK